MENIRSNKIKDVKVLSKVKILPYYVISCQLRTPILVGYPSFQC